MLAGSKVKEANVHRQRSYSLTIVIGLVAICVYIASEDFFDFLQRFSIREVVSIVHGSFREFCPFLWNISIQKRRRQHWIVNTF